MLPGTAPTAPPANQKRAAVERPLKVERTQMMKREVGAVAATAAVSAEPRHRSGDKGCRLDWPERPPRRSETAQEAA
jgi:hypothetical protein